MKRGIWSKSFILITIANLLLFFGFQMLQPTLPLYGKTIGATDSTIGWISGAFTISALLIRPTSGILLDKFNKKWVFISGLIIILLVTVGYGFIDDVFGLLLLRFIHGFGWGIAQTSSATIATASLDKKNLGKGMGYFSLSSSSAQAFAPFIAITLVQTTNFMSLFVVSAAIVALIGFILPLLKNKKTSEGSVEKQAMFEKTALFPAILTFFLTLTYGTLVGFLSIYGEEQGIINIGLFFTVFSLCLIILRPIFGAIIDKFDYDGVIYASSILIIIGFVLLSNSQVMNDFLLVALIYGIGSSGLQSSFQTRSLANAPNNRIGAANSTYFFGFDAGIGVGSVIGGMIAGWFNYQTMYLLFSVFGFAIIILYRLFKTKYF